MDLYLLTMLLLPIWKDMSPGNERIYRVTPEGWPSMIAGPSARMASRR